MIENIVELFRNSINNDYLSIVILALMPLIELRGAIPVAIGMNMSPILALLLSFVGSSLCVIPNMIFLKPILNFLKTTKLFKNFAISYDESLSKKADKIEKKSGKNKKLFYKYLGVCLFVSIPMPLTGAYTGSAVATFLNLKKIPTLVSIMIGNFIAGTILTLLSVYFVEYLDLIITILAISILFVVLMYLWKSIKKINIKNLFIHKKKN